MGFLEGGVENPPMLEIEVPVRLVINFEGKKLPVQELASSFNGLEFALLGRVLEEVDISLVNSICGKGYGENDYHRHDSGGRTVVTQLGETSFEVSRVKDKFTGSTFYPLYHLIDFRDGRYQDDVSAVSVDYALSMSYRDTTDRLDRTNQAPSPSTVWRRVQELGEGEKEVERNGLVSADGTKLHSQQGKKLDAKVVAGENFVVGVNEKYRNISKTDALAVGDADDELDCFVRAS